MSESLMYGAIIAVAAVALVLIGLYVGYHHAALAEKCKIEDEQRADDEVFAHEIDAPRLSEPPSAYDTSSSTLVKRPNAQVVRPPPIMTL